MTPPLVCSAHLIRGHAASPVWPPLLRAELHGAAAGRHQTWCVGSSDLWGGGRGAHTCGGGGGGGGGFRPVGGLSLLLSLPSSPPFHLPSSPLPSPSPLSLSFPLPFPPTSPYRVATLLAGWTLMRSWRSLVKGHMRQSTGALASEHLVHGVSLWSVAWGVTVVGSMGCHCRR